MLIPVEREEIGDEEVYKEAGKAKLQNNDVYTSNNVSYSTDQWAKS